MIYRIVNLSGVFYAYRFSSFRFEEENIREFIESGEPVVLCENLEDAAELLDIEVEEIEIVT